MLQEFINYLGVDMRFVVETGVFALMTLTSIINARRAFWRGRWRGERDERFSDRLDAFGENFSDRH